MSRGAGNTASRPDIGRHGACAAPCPGAGTVLRAAQARAESDCGAARGLAKALPDRGAAPGRGEKRRRH